jgi:hypothetical protein
VENYNRNVLYLKRIIADKVKELASSKYPILLDKERDTIIKSKIILIIYGLTGQHVYNFICSVDSYRDEYDFRLTIFDMDSKTANIFNNYDFGKLQKMKDRKQKIIEIFTDEGGTCKLD